MRFDVSNDLRAASLLSALGLDPRQVMRDLGEQDPFGLNLLNDGFDRVGNMGPDGILNLMRLGALQRALGMPFPNDMMGRSLRGWPDQQERFEPGDFPRGSTDHKLTKLFQSDPFGHQQLE